MRRGRKHNRKSMVLIISGILVVLLILIAAWYFVNNKSLSVGEETFRYCMGNKIEYSTEMKLSHSDSVTVIEDEEEVTSDGTPILFTKEMKMLLPVSMGYLKPSDKKGGVVRVNYFSTIEWENGITKIIHNGRTTEVREGFLYDGDGTYVFFENMRIQVGGASYVVTPMNYVKVFYKDSVEIYDVQKEEYQYVISGDSDVIAISNTGYEVNLGTGVLTKDGTQRILFSDIEAMNSLE